jgi:hypothetical protein
MTQLRSRPVSQRVQWQLEQQGLHPLLARVYAGRGIVARSELDYEFSSLLLPTRLTNAAAAAVILADAIADRQRILIVADYDCDGATACASASGHCAPWCDSRLSGAEPLHLRLRPVARHRRPRGEQKPDLIVTVDNGIASVDGVARARELGIATLITDHHLPGDELPAADCIVNPNQPGLRLSEQVSGRRRRDVLRDARAARRVAQPQLVWRGQRAKRTESRQPARPGGARHRRRRRQASTTTTASSSARVCSASGRAD